MPGSLHSRDFGKNMPQTRISKRIIHVGVTVKDRSASDRLYKDILGFHAIWHGGMTDSKTDWVDMRVPDGTDWLEYMLNVNNPFSAYLGCDAPYGIRSAERAGWIRDGARTRVEAGETESGARWQMAVEPLRSGWNAR